MLKVMAEFEFFLPSVEPEAQSYGPVRAYVYSSRDRRACRHPCSLGSWKHISYRMSLGTL
jgi:hypothetical protein